MIALAENDTRETYVTTIPPDFPNRRDWWIRGGLLAAAAMLHGGVRHSAGSHGHLQRIAGHRFRIRAAEAFVDD